MPIGRQARGVLKRLVFGSATYPDQCAIGLTYPQSEVCVWLRGLGPPREVTGSNVVACARPFTIGVFLEGRPDASALGGTLASLEFHSQDPQNRLLGTIHLRAVGAIPVSTGELRLFQALDCRNYCLPRARLWARYLHYGLEQWRSATRSRASDFRMTARELHCVFVFYICPRPVVLVSVVDSGLANIFPMDLIGPIGPQHFSFALHTTSTGVPLMERSRRIALSSVPVEQTSVAYALGQNHKTPCADLDHLPFPTTFSPTFGLPIPRFSLRVREMQIEAVRTLGSHTLFLARTVEDQRWAEGLQLFFVHGFYQAWRQARLQKVRSG
jgi:flavin reductase (DIM6/NTAB) family NADH-FMN oxidoreductase RutF